jgi:hypothetical protein
MNALAYIILTSAKNRLLEVIRKPAKLVLYLLVIAGIAGILILSLFTRNTVENFVDIVYLKGIVFALILIFFIIAIVKALKSGDVVFDMSDVNFLFVSPLRPQGILLYGVSRMMGMSFLAGFFILFQGNSLGMWWGLYFGDLLLIFGGFILAVSLMQILSLLIYSLTNGSPGRKLFVKIAAFVMFLPMTADAIRHYAQSNGDIMLALANLLRSPVSSWTPVAGWAASGVTAFISGDAATGFIFFGVIIVTGALLIFYIMKSNPDYYEDAIVATETAFERKRVITEGQANMEALSDKKVKIAATGIGGNGASAIFFKHLRESFRANRFGLWGVMSIVIVLTSAAIAYITTIPGAEVEGSGAGVVIILQALMWMQIFLIGTGRGLKELSSHYIYMLPESSFKKIVWGNLEIVLKALGEGIFAFAAAGVIMGESPVLVILAITAYTLFSLLLIGINYLSLRWAGADMTAGILMLIYMIAVIVIMFPGVAAAFIVGGMVEGLGVPAGLAILSAWELFAALRCFALSKGILDRCDMPAVRIGK